MSLTRRRFTQILASTLFLHHLPVLCTISQILGLTDASPKPKTLHASSAQARPPIYYCWLSRQKKWSVFPLLILPVRH